MAMSMGVARQKSDDKRAAILAAAVRLIVGEGLGAATAAIAKEAGIANGSLFTYFPTKVDLHNQLYLELKNEMVHAALDGMPPKASLKNQFFHVWSGWARWAIDYPDRRRALALLGSSDDLTPATRMAGHAAMGPLVELIDRSRAKGALKAAPLGLVASIMNASAEATMDFMLQDPAHAEAHLKVGIEAVWRMLG